MHINKFFFLFFLSVNFIFSQNIKLDDVKNLLEGVINTKKNKNREWSGTPGDTDFSIADRIAIQDVINAYGVYWDENNLKEFFNLFSEDAIRITIDENGNDIFMNKSDEIKIANKRHIYFKENLMQRRHMMHNTHFIKQTENFAKVKQYMTLMSTSYGKKPVIISPIIYDFEFKKIRGIWKISQRKINLDRELDLPLKK